MRDARRPRPLRPLQDRAGVDVPSVEADRLVALVGHELRTPLTMMVGYTEILGCGDAGVLTPEQQQMVAAVERGAERVHELVEDLLTVAGPALGQDRCTGEVADAVRRLAGVEDDAARSPDRLRVPA